MFQMETCSLGLPDTNSEQTNLFINWHLLKTAYCGVVINLCFFVYNISGDFHHHIRFASAFFIAFTDPIWKTIHISEIMVSVQTDGCKSGSGEHTKGEFYH